MRGYLLDIPLLVAGDTETAVGAVSGVAVRGEPGDEARLSEAERGQDKPTPSHIPEYSYPVRAAVLERVRRVLVEEVREARAVLHRDLVRGRLQKTRASGAITSRNHVERLTPAAVALNKGPTFWLSYRSASAMTAQSASLGPPPEGVKQKVLPVDKVGQYRS